MKILTSLIFQRWIMELFMARTAILPLILTGMVMLICWTFRCWMEILMLGYFQSILKFWAAKTKLLLSIFYKHKGLSMGKTFRFGFIFFLCFISFHKGYAQLKFQKV